jgi:hypothetical protein
VSDETSEGGYWLHRNAQGAFRAGMLKRRMAERPLPTGVIFGRKPKLNETQRPSGMTKVRLCASHGAGDPPRLTNP